MRPHFLIFVFLTVVTISFNGCSEDDDDNNNNNNTPTCTDGIQNGNETGVDCGGSCTPCSSSIPKIKTYTLTNSAIYDVEETYEYDTEGRVKTITYVGATKNGTSTFSYGSNVITETMFSGLIATYTLNSQGYVTHKVVVQPSSNDTVSTTDYTYDNDGHLISDGNDTFTWSGDNMVSSIGITYTYLTDKNNTIGNANKGMAFLGKDSKNLVQTITYTTGQTFSKAYVYDSFNRVTKVNSDETYSYF